MKKNKIQDERILAERRKIQSTGYSWIVRILLLSIIVQQFIMKAPFEQYAVEFYILIGCGFYNIIANYKKGIDIWNPSNNDKIKLFINTVISGILSVFVLVLLSGEHQMNELVEYFVTFVVFFFGIRLIMIRINNKKQEKINRDLDSEE